MSLAYRVLYLIARHLLITGSAPKRARTSRRGAHDHRAPGQEAGAMSEHPALRGTREQKKASGHVA